MADKVEHGRMEGWTDRLVSAVQIELIVLIGCSSAFIVTV